MDQISGPTPSEPPTKAHDRAQAPASLALSETPAVTPPETPGFRSRGRARRRARFLRKARELAYRDLGGLVFNLHRFGQRNDALVLAKLTTIGHIDTELRALEGALGERRPVTVLREAGVTACPRCAAIHSSEDGFCPNCGLALSRRVDLPAEFQPPAAAPPPPPAAVPAPVQPPPGAPVASPPPAPSQSTAVTPPPQPSQGRSPVPPSPTPPFAPPEPSTRSQPAAPERSGEPVPTAAAGGQADERDSPTEIIRPPGPAT